MKAIRKEDSVKLERKIQLQMLQKIGYFPYRVLCDFLFHNNSIFWVSKTSGAKVQGLNQHVLFSSYLAFNSFLVAKVFLELFMQVYIIHG